MASKTAPVAATLLPAVLQPAPDTPDLPAPPACFSPCRDPRSARVPPRAHHRHLRPRQALQVQEGLQGRLQAAQVVAWQVVGMARRASGGHGQACQWWAWPGGQESGKHKRHYEYKPHHCVRKPRGPQAPSAPYLCEYRVLRAAHPL